MIDLSKIAQRYVVRDDGSAGGAWSLEIPGAHGMIYPYSERGQLAVLAFSSSAIRKLAALGLRNVQRAQAEAVFIFDPRLLEDVARIVQSKRRPS